MNGHKNRSKLVEKQRYRHEVSKTKEKEVNPFYELVFTFRSNSVYGKDGIASLLAKAVNQFMLNHKQGDFCNDSANYSYHLTTHKERKANKDRKWICDLPEAE